MLSQDIFLIFRTYWLLLTWQMVSWPVVARWFRGHLVDSGWAVSRLVGWLGVSLLAWWGGYLGIPIWTTAWVMAGLWLVVGVWTVAKQKKELKKDLKIIWKLIIVEEVLFVIGFFGVSIVRGYNPAILDLEKFMDVGFMQAYLKSRTLPAVDMWLAGEKINYYTFGHFMGAVMNRLWGVDLRYGYNLLLGLLMGLVMSGSFSVVVNLVGRMGRKVMLGGVMGAMLVAVGGNSQTMWYWLKNRTFTGYWYADATRFIENTIHEFPSYSFVVSDLHAHLWNLPIVLLFLLVLMAWGKQVHLRGVLILGVLLGVMAMTNTWDLFIYSLLGFWVAVWLLSTRRVGIERLTVSLVVGVAAMIVTSGFWWLNFENIGEGGRWVSKRSPLWQLAALWGGHMFITAIAVMKNANFQFSIFKRKQRAQKRSNVMIYAMGVTATMLLVIPELIYVKDIYPNHPRANTMFKLTYQAFVLMGLLGGWAMSQFSIFHANSSAVRQAGKFQVSKLILIPVFAGLMLFPWFGYRGYYGFTEYHGLDGLAWLMERHPDDYQAVMWLKENAEGRSVVLEAVGESYTTFARVSTFTGLPTVLGWRVHEWLWRGGFEIPAKRTEEVKVVYERPGSEEARTVLDKYQVKYIFVGDKEREVYRVDEKGVLELGKVVFESGETRIVEISNF